MFLDFLSCILLGNFYCRTFLLNFSGEKENALSNMKKLNRCLQVQKVSFKEKENLLLEEKRKNKTLKTNVSELNEKLAASEQSIQNLKEQQDLMLSLDVQNCSKNDSSSNALEEKLKNEIDQLKNELNATKSTVIIIALS